MIVTIEIPEPIAATLQTHADAHNLPLEGEIVAMLTRLFAPTPPTPGVQPNVEHFFATYHRPTLEEFEATLKQLTAYHKQVAPPRAPLTDEELRRESIYRDEELY